MLIRLIATIGYFIVANYYFQFYFFSMKQPVTNTYKNKLFASRCGSSYHVEERKKQHTSNHSCALTLP